MEILFPLLLLLCVQHVHLERMDSSPFPADSHFSMNINMPDVNPNVPDAYICTAKKLDPREAYIVKYEPDVRARTAHHMLLFGCKDVKNSKHTYPKSWDCAQGDVCNRKSIIYGWAKNAPAMELPPDVGFLISGNSSIQYLVLQIHYAKPLPDSITDNSGLKLHLTTQRQRYITGIRLLFGDSAVIPPHRPKIHVDVNCKFVESYTIHPFAYRVHTHKLGVVVTGYSYNTVNNSWTFLAKGNPQWPQAFYPMQQKVTITNDDILAARCTYNSTEMNIAVSIGSHSNDEMCNLYIMYYTEYRNALAGQSPPCTGVQFEELVDNLPPENDTPLPPNPELEQQAFGSGHHHTAASYNTFPDRTSQSVSYNSMNRLNDIASHLRVRPNSNGAFNTEYMYKEVHGWPSKTLKFGQIAAVTVDHDGSAIIFHRGDHVWNELTFDYFHNYQLVSEGPIKKPTVVHLDSVTGLLLKEWGQNIFYMPHGLSIGPDGSFWMTDVAMHQVFQFSRKDLKKPVLILGEKFVPGNDNDHFCKPASVAVSKNGEIYIADGYCNSRVVRFSADGKYLSQWGKENNVFERHPPVGSFRIPHKILILEDRDLTCVADRENGRIQCFTLVSGRFRFVIEREEFGGSLYSIAYAPEKGLLMAICGEAIYKDHTVQAFVFNITDQKLLNVFSPEDNNKFTRPHDIAVLPSGDEAFVCEIGPNVVWKFIRVYHKSSKKVLDASPLLHGPHGPSSAEDKKTVSQKSKSTDDKTTADAEDSTRFETSLIIMSLLAIPVLCLIVITIIVRLKRKGKLQQSYFGNLKGWWGGYRTPHPQDKFNLGSLLNPHKGFDRVSVEESDAEGEDGSDSDVEEYSAIARKT